MKKLLSLPPQAISEFYRVMGNRSHDWFCAPDPKGVKVGSGGGTVALIDAWRADESFSYDSKAIMIHACGESRRLPAYAPIGKVLTPIPVFRWATGQRIDQTLLSLQLPLYEQIMESAPESSRLLVASGDVFIDAGEPMTSLPEADVVCLGMWVEAERASNHGVFVVDRERPSSLRFMLQKPSIRQLSQLSADSYFLMDVGVWVLSGRAIAMLSERARKAGNGNVGYYDLYGDFGRCLGYNPSDASDSELSSLSVAIVPLPKGHFYHFGTTADLVASTLALQSIVADQRLISQRKIKPHPSLFTQNCICRYNFNSKNKNIWIENSTVGEHWSLTSDNVITGVPDNDWHIALAPGVCLDIVAIGEQKYAVRPYGYNDPMRGLVSDSDTVWMGRPIAEWMSSRRIPQEAVGDVDIQQVPLFPVVESVDVMERVIKWMTSNPEDEVARAFWLSSPRLSASAIAAEANLKRMAESRMQYLKQDLKLMAEHYDRSVFYQLDLSDVGSKMDTVPEPLPLSAPLMQCARNYMLRFIMTGDDKSRADAFDVLRHSVLSAVDNSGTKPSLQVQSDQIVWSRSPVRIDFAGGWTDTPPYSLTNGASVVNMAVELNGQPPLQAFVKPSKEHHIVIRSIDMSASETITEYAQLTDFHRVGSPFSIPKAALALAGFSPQFSSVKYKSLRSQLEDFGSGIEITILSAVPAGSGLGTSSILASTVLAAICEFAGLGWSKSQICSLTLALEQLLTTGGGWQDQFGGVTEGVKLLQTDPGLIQQPLTRWLPDTIFTNPQYRPCHLLYYTGITRVAKNILSEIVTGMFLNRNEELRLLGRMKAHSFEVADAIQRANFVRFGSLVAKTWRQNCKLDAGTNPAEVAQIIDSVSDMCLGCKLPGAGGGGFLYMVAKDEEAASRIRRFLTQNPPNERARFVDMTISASGLQTSRS